MKIKNAIMLLLIAAALASCSGNEEKTSGSHNDQKDLYTSDKGKALFETKCATCHGNDGTAGVGNAANLQISRLDAASVKEVMQNGKNGMPTFSGQLTSEEMDKVAAYVLTLRK